MSRLPAFWQKHFLELEAAIIVVATVILVSWYSAFDGAFHMNEFILGNRANIYRTTASIAGTLLGFSIAVASLILNFASSPRLALLRESQHYPSLWETFFQATKFLGALTVMALVCLIWDKDSSPCTWLVIPFCFFAGLSAVRLVRVIWILEQIIGIVSTPSPDLHAARGAYTRGEM